jgi:hypothetical protein
MGRSPAPTAASASAWRSSASLVELHGGSIEAQSEAGPRVTLHRPAACGPSTAGAGRIGRISTRKSGNDPAPLQAWGAHTADTSVPTQSSQPGAPHACRYVSPQPLPAATTPVERGACARPLVLVVEGDPESADAGNAAAPGMHDAWRWPKTACRPWN